MPLLIFGPATNWNDSLKTKMEYARSFELTKYVVVDSLLDSSTQDAEADIVAHLFVTVYWSWRWGYKRRLYCSAAAWICCSELE